MSPKGCLTACIVATIVLSFAQPVQAADACQAIATSGTGKDQASATKNAERNLNRMAESMKGKLKKATTRCHMSGNSRTPNVVNHSCTAYGSVCRKLENESNGHGD